MAYPVAVAPVTYGGGYGGYGGCGGCGAPTAAVVFAQPVAPAPIAVGYWGGNWGGPTWSGSWGGYGSGGYGYGYGGCGGCGGRGLIGYGAPSPLYVVNQGPYYSGPGLMVPYATYSPEAAYAPAADYPYASGNGYGYPPPAYRPYYRPRYAYRAPIYGRPRLYGPMVHHYRWHRY